MQVVDVDVLGGGSTRNPAEGAVSKEGFALFTLHVEGRVGFQADPAEVTSAKTERFKGAAMGSMGCRPELRRRMW